MVVVVAWLWRGCGVAGTVVTVAVAWLSPWLTLWLWRGWSVAGALVGVLAVAGTVVTDTVAAVVAVA